MKVDVEGNVYCGGAGGIWIMDKTGKKLGRIVHGAPATTNIAFGGDDWKTLYFTSRNHLGSVKVKIRRHPGAGRQEIEKKKARRHRGSAKLVPPGFVWRRCGDGSNSHPVFGEEAPWPIPARLKPGRAR